MNQNASFFSLASLKQPVNQWICVAFLAVLCFWVVLYYFAERAKIVGEAWAGSSSQAALEQELKN